MVFLLLSLPDPVLVSVASEGSSGCQGNGLYRISWLISLDAVVFLIDCEASVRVEKKRHFLLCRPDI